MKLIITFLIAAWFAAFQTASALTIDKNQPVDISSDEVDVNLETNKHTFIGNVRLIQGSLKLKADHLVADYVNGDLVKAVAKGNPAAFKQRADGKQVDDEGEGKTIILNQKNNTLQLLKKAMIKQEGNIARGENIFYDRNSGKLQVKGNASGSTGSGKNNKALQSDPFFNQKKSSNQKSTQPIIRKKSNSTKVPDEIILPSQSKASNDDEEDTGGRSRLIILPKSQSN